MTNSNYPPSISFWQDENDRLRFALQETMFDPDVRQLWGKMVQTMREIRDRKPHPNAESEASLISLERAEMLLGIRTLACILRMQSPLLKHAPNPCLGAWLTILAEKAFGERWPFVFPERVYGLLPDKPARRDKNEALYNLEQTNWGHYLQPLAYHEPYKTARRRGRPPGSSTIPPEQMSKFIKKYTAVYQKLSRHTKRPRQADVAQELGIDERTLQRYRDRYKFLWPPV